MVTEEKMKAKFRTTARWKKFRQQKYIESNHKDFITGKPLRKGWNLHHLDLEVEHYENLDPKNFICLNKKTHDLIHFLYRYKDYKKVLKQIEIALDKMHELNEEYEC